MSRPETKEKHRAAIKFAWTKPEVRAKFSNGLRKSTAASWMRPEIRAKRIAGIKAALAKPEWKAKHSARMKEQWAAKRRELLP